MNGTVWHVPASRFFQLLGNWLAGDGPLARRLADAVEKAIRDGRLPLGARLPAERLLAGEFGLARGTVTMGYQILRAEQLIVTRTGSGSTVSLPRLHERLSPWASDRGEAGKNGAPLDLTIAEPAAPFGELLQAVREATDTLSATLLRAPSEGAGPSALRTAIADAYEAQGLATDSGHLLLTSGADVALSLLSAAYLRPNSRVVLDSPTYPGALALFRGAGARLVSQPLTPTGWDVPAMDRTLATARPSLTYLIADFHNPTGLLMGKEERAELRRRLHAHDTLVVFDETMRDLDLREGAAPPPRITSCAGDRHVVYVGSLSKSLWPGLRVGWIRAHPDVTRRLAALPLAAALAPSPFDQLVAARLLERQRTVLGRRRAQLRSQRNYLVARLAGLPWCCFPVPQGGRSLWLMLLDAAPLPFLWPRNGAPGPRVRYGCVPPVEVDDLGGVAAGLRGTA
ncbi:PLP-dependent aminotransferase family protein (plasmid) [Streptomyces sp. NBC_01591]|uniref:aminotransferase-like domain-containing protein n=1 Tax=Streptomyces sp. NBC_01591 TaxID=2975888 RepID=UPI002DD9D134|nr:PLP-dependent aminotransferase family protein [Streptomyces sp. NBC_01591]WSD66085.1 PLP-dependent aminotransferase family protein [Streptomyces sp. NBC_01591]WSD73033.1 PLP-dependent aminotransferase family protein [Streptomyces sp. NBC_01591]WSD73692.1 PLP-dependent aminotransferase family protein [Streptomyces sp. NBC_01591]WSD74520.1 PLP-dependent aminotransferase family protein [Streptomyces sp. NBC_01591]